MSQRYIYVASRASVPERPAMWRELRERGVPIVSSWIDEAGEGETASNRELWLRIDNEIGRSEALVLYVEPGDFPLKGALVEVGMALARSLPVFIVAPGVELDKSLRPIGSWPAHSLVEFYPSIHELLPTIHDLTFEPSYDPV